MALNNIFTEPQREITESTVGILFVGGIIGGFCYIDYHLALSLHNASEHSKTFNEHLLIATFILVAGIILFFGTILITHAIGESICNAFEKRGIQLRPKHRYRRDSRNQRFRCSY